MRILFVVNRMAHVRHFDRAVRLLADRGHDVRLASQDEDVELRGVLARQARITALDAPRNRTDDWSAHATVLRRARDYVRYLHPRYAEARLLRGRAFEKLVRAVSGPDREIGPDWSELLRGVNKGEHNHLDALLAKLETTVPSDPAIDAFVEAQRPDALVLSPMVGIGFSQADFVKSTRRLGVPSGMLAFSWDNLSNKGLIHEMPDRLFVWNEVQRFEAVKLHLCPADRVVVTGAPRFDELFEMRPATTREEFAGMLGVDPSRPMLLYLCSSKFVAPRERAFVERWIREVRRSPEPAVAEATLVVRPHPGAMQDWREGTPTIARWRNEARDKAAVSRPFDDERAILMTSSMQNADQVLFDSIHHSAAVVGLNTSAEIEAGIVGRPVYTIVDPDAEGQQGTLHFHYLLNSRGGHVTPAADFDGHRAHLADAVAGRYDAGAITAFVRSFVRPHGLERPVAPIVAEAIEALAAVPSPSPS